MPDGLMMKAVYPDLSGSQNPPQRRLFKDPDFMKPIPFGCRLLMTKKGFAVLRLRVNILPNVAAHGNIHHLNPSANTKYRDISGISLPREGKFQPVPAGVDVADGRMGLLSEPAWIRILPARQKKPVQPCHYRTCGSRIQCRDQKWKSPGPVNPFKVSRPQPAVSRLPIVITGDADNWPHNKPPPERFSGWKTSEIIRIYSDIDPVPID